MARTTTAKTASITTDTATDTTTDAATTEAPHAVALAELREIAVADIATDGSNPRTLLAIFAQRTEKVKVPRGYDSGSSPSSSCNDRHQISGSA